MSSTSPDEHAAEAHEPGAHAFDGEPARALPPDEPRTPGWIPAVGLLVFLFAGIALLARGGADKGEGPAKPAAPAQAAPAQAAPPQAAPAPRPQPPAVAPRPQPPAVAQPGVAAPRPAGSAAGAGSAGANIRTLPREQIDLIKKRLEERRGAPLGQPAPPPAP